MNHFALCPGATIPALLASAFVASVIIVRALKPRDRGVNIVSGSLGNSSESNSFDVMPKQKQADGTVKVEFKTKDGKTVLFSRKPAKKDKAPKRAAEAAETEAPEANQSKSSKKQSGNEGQSKDRPTDLQPVLVLSDD